MEQSKTIPKTLRHYGSLAYAKTWFNSAIFIADPIWLERLIYAARSILHPTLSNESSTMFEFNRASSKILALSQPIN